MLQKRKERIDAKLEDMSVDLASDSLIEADNILKDKEKLNHELRERTLEIIEEYKNQLSPDLYTETKKIIEQKTSDEAKEEQQEEKKKTTGRGRPKKSEN